MSGAQSSLLSFPGPGARGSRLVALWVTEMESCQGYHDGALRCGWLAASCLNNAAEQRMPVDVVPVEPFPDRVSVVSRRASMSRRAAQDCAAGFAGPLVVQWAAQTGRPRRGRGEAGQRKLVGGRSTVQMSRSGRPEKQMGHGGMLDPHSGPRAGPRSIGRVLGGKDPLPALRYQDARAGRRGCTLLCPA